jgi:hypothetical protein
MSEEKKTRSQDWAVVIILLLMIPALVQIVPVLLTNPRMRTTAAGVLVPDILVFFSYLLSFMSALFATALGGSQYVGATGRIVSQLGQAALPFSCCLNSLTLALFSLTYWTMNHSGFSSVSAVFITLGLVGHFAGGAWTFKHADPLARTVIIESLCWIGIFAFVGVVTLAVVQLSDVALLPISLIIGIAWPLFYAVGYAISATRNGFHVSLDESFKR